MVMKRAHAGMPLDAGIRIIPLFVHNYGSSLVYVGNVPGNL